jgi:hypothetical protein
LLGAIGFQASLQVVFLETSVDAACDLLVRIAVWEIIGKWSGEYFREK